MPEPVTALTGIAAPLDLSNVDTDQIMPARFMRRPRDERYAQYGFHDLRFGPDGSPRPDFPLNRPPWDRAAILVAGRNFGVGSSREAAVYALQALGLRCVVASSFGDIFFGNALKNGLLPVQLDEAAVAALREAAASEPGLQLTVSLERQILSSPAGAEHGFTIPAFARECLLRGLDEIGLTMTLLPRIEAFERRKRMADAQRRAVPQP